MAAKLGQGALEERLAAIPAVGVADAGTYPPLCQTHADPTASSAEKKAGAERAAASAAQASPAPDHARQTR